MIKQSLQVWRMKITKLNCHFLHILTWHILLLILIIWLRYCLSGFSSVPPYILYSLEGNHNVQSTLKEWLAIHYIVEGDYLHNYWEFCIGDLSLLPPLFIQSFIDRYHYGLMDIYFVLWVIIQYNLFCFSNSSSFDHWALFWLDFHVLLTYPIIFLGHLYFVALQDAPSSSCISFFLPNPIINHFFKESWFLLRENYVRNQDLGIRYAYCYSCLIASRSFQLIEKGNICIYTNPCISIYTYMYL